jgi:hypothetical protein
MRDAPNDRVVYLAARANAIMAETSFAGAGQADRWTTTTASNMNQRYCLQAGDVPEIAASESGANRRSVRAADYALDDICF